MPETSKILVGTIDEFGPESRKQLRIDGSKVVVLRVGDSFYAYENRCLHMGGPVGEGIVIGKVEAVLDDQQRVVCEKFSTEDMQLVCPWHGWAFDVSTGEFAGDKSMRLNKYETRVDGGNVYVIP